MATYLELCKSVLELSNTGYGAQLNSVTSNNLGINASLAIRFVKMAWSQIQTDQEWWGWMRKEFKFVPNGVDAEYSWNQMTTDGNPPAADGANRSIPDGDGVRTWLHSPSARWFSGARGNSQLEQLSYDEWVRRNRTETSRGRPLYIAFSPEMKLCIHPRAENESERVPIFGVYQKAPQQLSNNTDDPAQSGFPVEYHDAIAFRALNLLASHNQTMEQIEFATRMENDIMADVRRIYLPGVRVKRGIDYLGLSEAGT